MVLIYIDLHGLINFHVTFDRATDGQIGITWNTYGPQMFLFESASNILIRSLVILREYGSRIIAIKDLIFLLEYDPQLIDRSIKQVYRNEICTKS